MAAGSGKRERTKFPGVYQRSGAERRHDGKADLCFDITYKDAGGRKVWEKVGWRSEGYTAAMASQVRAERLRSTRHSDMPEIVMRGRPELTLGEAWKAYDTQRLGKTKRPSTDRGRWKLHLAHLESLPISALTPLKLENLKASLAGKGLSPQTTKHALTLLSRAINHAIRMRLWAGANPVRDVAMPNVDNKRFRFLSALEADQLLQAIRERSEDTWRICMMSLYTGMRFSEIATLRWEAVNLDAKVAQALDPKNGISRTVALTASIVDMLRSIGSKSGLVFPGARGKAKSEEGRERAAKKRGPLIRYEISSAYSRAVERLGLNADVTDRRGKVVFHTLRHTYASWLAMSGVPLYQLMDLMGHRTIEMTKRYASLCPSQGKEANEHIERLLAGAAMPAGGHTSSAGGPG